MQAEGETHREYQLRLESYRRMDIADAARDIERARLSSLGKKFYVTECGNKVPIYADDRSDGRIRRIEQQLIIGSHVGRCGAQYATPPSAPEMDASAQKNT